MMGKTAFYIYSIFKDFFMFFVNIFLGIRNILRKPFTLVFIYILSSIMLIIISLLGFFSNKGVNTFVLIIWAIVIFTITVWSHIECGYYEELYKKYKDRKQLKEENSLITKE